jgi:Raf kinase inhibitor-like YbhB/YbcL family protein
MTQKAFFFPVVMSLILCMFLSGCTGTSPPEPQNITGVQSGGLMLQVDSLAPGSMLPLEYTCAGAGMSPPVSWTNVPQGTQSLVLVLYDPDAPVTGGFTHWVVYNLPPGSTGIPGNVSPVRELPGGGSQGINSRGTVGYVPLCPPNGSTHRYVFQLFALDTTITGTDIDRSSVSEAISGHSLGEDQVVMMFGQ